MNQKMIDILQQHIIYIENKYRWNTSSSDMLLTYGPTHIIYDDYNLDLSSIQFCRNVVLEDIADPHNPKRPWYMTETDEDKRIPFLMDVLKLLDALEAIPEDERYVWEEEDF